MQKRTTAFVTLPIVALAAAALAVVLASLIIGARESDAIALTRQRETIEHAIDQHGLALARELRVQSVWSEAFKHARAGDTGWLRTFYGEYLSSLLGYDRVYVATTDGEPVYGFIAAQPDAPNDFAAIGPKIADLLRAVTAPDQAPEGYVVVKTQVKGPDGAEVQHRAVSDTRNIAGKPSTVIVSTIVPDRPTVELAGLDPYVLVAIENFDRQITHRLGTTFGFRGLKWIAGETSKVDDVEVVRGLDGSKAGTLAWQKDRPGIQFVQRVAPGLITSLFPILALTYLLILWGNRQAKRILHSEAQATSAARTDPLTGLPNRIALHEIFARMLSEAKAQKSTLGVLSLDIDNFKGINDAFGHTVGDAVLQSMGKRLQNLFGPSGYVARPDGDTFVTLLAGVDDSNVAELASDAMTALAEPFDLEGGTRVFITSSGGYAIGPRDGDSEDELLRRVGLALDKAKEGGTETAVAFEPAMDLEVTYRRSLESALRKAVSEGSIEVVYQPLMDPGGSRIIGVEALARWTDPLLGPISPDIFIPLAEETGLIHQIGEHVLRRAVLDGKAWPGISVAVNVSAAQIHHGDVVEVVRDVLRSTGFPAQRLEIEITESVLLADEKRANEQMRGLQALGVKVALDDFGTGYSSLQYLRNFGFDKLKIDRSFIDGAGAPQDSSVILASIIRLGHDLDLTITAEGVETAEQQRWLQEAGCHQLQGYLFSRPLGAEPMSKFIAAHNASTAVAS